MRCARAYDDYLTGWDERGAPWEYWVERAETARATFARLRRRRARRRRGDDVALGRREPARERDRLRGAAEGRDQRLRVPDDRPDLARAGAARGRGRPRARRRGRDPGRAVRRGDRRADRGRLDRGRLLPQRLAARRRGDREDRARARRAGRARRLPGDRHVSARRAASSASTCSPPACSSTCSARPGSASCGRGPASSEQLLPTQTGWFADQDIFEMDIDDYSPSPTARRFQSGTPPVPAIYAGIAGLELMEEIGVAETREPRDGAERAADRRRRRARRASSSRRATRSGAARSSASARPTRRALVAALGSRRDRHLGARRQPAGLRPRLQHRGRHRRRARRRSPATARCWLPGV